VRQYTPGTRVVDAHLAPTDTVVVDAEDGDIVGELRVRRREGFGGVMYFGYFIAIVGSIGSLLAGTVAQASTRDYFDIAPMFWGMVGSAGALAVGVPMIAIGKHGTLVVEPNARGPRACFALPFTVQF